MTNPMGQTAVPAAWYPDPADARQLRYWDGMGWTGQLAPNPQAADRQPMVDAPLLSRRRQRASRDEPMHVAEPITGSTRLIPSPSTMVEPEYPYVPMVRATSAPVAPTNVRRVGPTLTPAIWFYVLTPLLAVPFLVAGPVFDSGDVWSVARAALLGVLIIALAVFAGLDHVQLQQREIPNAPTSLVGIIPLVFVIVRTMRVGRSGVAVLLVSLLVQAVVVELALTRVYPVFA